MKRIMSFLLAALLLLTMCPVTALADDLGLDFDDAGGGYCEHWNTDSRYSSNGDGYSHQYEIVCMDCGEYVDSYSDSCMDDDYDGYCDYCWGNVDSGGMVECDHGSYSDSCDFTSNDDGTHHVQYWHSMCQGCGIAWNRFTDPTPGGSGEEDPWDGPIMFSMQYGEYYADAESYDESCEPYLYDGVCELCGWEYVEPACEHETTEETASYTSNGDKTHTVTTTVTCANETCREKLSSETATEACADQDKDLKCDACGGSVSTVIAEGSCGEDGSDLNWNLTEDGTLTISGEGTMKNWGTAGSGGEKAPWAQYADQIKKVTIGAGVTGIGSGAFFGCSKIEGFFVEDGNSSFTSQDGVLYSSDMKTLIAYPAGKEGESVTIPEGVTTILPYAFSGSILVEIILPESVTIIREYAFYHCELLVEINIPKGVTVIEEYAFYNCKALIEINILGDVTIIKKYAFYGCESLPEIDLPDGLEEIDEHAFDGCKVLIRVIMPESVTIIEKYAFYNCEMLVEINIPEGVTVIEEYAFYNCKALIKINIKGNVTIIKKYAFYGCESLPGIDLPEGTEEIEDHAFDGCVALIEIVLPKSVTIIREYAFYNCKALVKINIPEGVTIIEKYSFYDCEALVEINIEGDVTIIEEYAFYGCKSLITIVLPDGLTDIGDRAFSDCEALINIYIPGSVKIIREYAFNGCKAMVKINIPNGVTIIRKYAFYNCSALVEITIYGSVNVIEEHAFETSSENTSLYYHGTQEQWAKVDLGSSNSALEEAESHYLDKGYAANNDATHTYGDICSDCGEIFGEKTVTDCADEDDDRLCDLCGWEFPCEHETTESSYTPNGNDTHINSGICVDCEEVVSRVMEDCTDADDDLVCEVCGGPVSCKHVVVHTENVSNGNETHTIKTICDRCGSLVTQITVACTDADDDLICDVCEGAVSCKHKNMKQEYAYASNDDETHTVTTTDICLHPQCGKTVSVTTSQGVCVNENDDRLCDLCGWEYPCTHETVSYTYAMSEDETHVKTGTCAECSKVISVDTEDCTDIEDDLVCDKCEDAVSCKHRNVTESTSYHFDGNNRHTVTDVTKCLHIKCGATVSSSTYVSYCVDDNVDFDCDRCGGEYVYSGTCGENVSWRLDSSKQLVISGSGAMDDSFYPFAPWHDLRSKIESAEILYGVTTIADGAFEYHDQLKTVSIPDGVTFIGGHAFDGCTALTEITLPNTVTVIDMWAFAGCTTLTKITLPDGVQVLEQFAFAGCENVTEITIPGSVTCISQHALGLDSLTDVYYYGTPDAYANIHIDQNNEPLSAATIHYMGLAYTANGDGTHTYGDTCSDCGLILGEGEITDCMDENADRICDLCGWEFPCEHKNVNVSFTPNNDETHTNVGTCADCGEVVTEIVEECADADEDLKCDLCGGNVACTHVNTEETVSYEANGDETHTVTTTVTCLNEHCGEELSSETAQAACSDENEDRLCDLCGGEIPCEHKNVNASFTPNHDETHTNVGTCADCGEVVTEILEECADADEDLKCDLCGGNVACTHVNTEETVFYEANGDETHTVTTKVTCLNEHCGEELSSETEQAACTDENADRLCDLCGGTVVCKHLFVHTQTVCGDNENHTVKTICDDCEAVVTQITVACVDEDENLVCDACEGAVACKHTNTEKTLSYEAGSDKTHTVTTKEICTNVYCGAQIASESETADCTDENADGLCDLCGSKLTMVFASGECGANGDNLLWTLTEDGVLTISGEGEMATYAKNTAPWIAHMDKLQTLKLEEGITAIGNYAFYGCSTLTGDLIFPDSVTTIGGFSFQNCSGFDGILDLGSVVTIGNYAFHSCSGLTGDLTIPESCTSVGTYAFYGCKGFKGSLTLSSKLTKIRTYAFNLCSGLTGELVLPEGITAIGAYAFYNCKGLTGDLVIPDKVTEIGNYAFRKCAGFESITMGSSVSEIGKQTFTECSNADTVTFLGAAPTVVASSSSDRSFDAGKTLTYLPGNPGWTDSDAYDAANGTWNGYALQTTASDCVDEDKDTYCDDCGRQIVFIDKVEVAGSNMNLGNELQVNFIVNNLPEGEYTAYVYQDTGKEDGTVYEIPSSQWEPFGTTRFKVAVRVRAMEMADTLILTIKDADGYERSEVYSTSAREYAAKALVAASSTAQMKTLVVDMLNYGAAAQTNFGYKISNLANAGLTDAQKKLATASVTCSNNQIKGTNNLGANLALDDCILLNVFFSGFKTRDVNATYAKVTFTNWKGESKEVTIPGSEFSMYGTADRYKVTIDDIVLADAYCLVTVEVYDEGASEPFAYGADSVESYANRGSSTAAAPLYNAIMKFATSAKAYLLSRQ